MYWIFRPAGTIGVLWSVYMKFVVAAVYLMYLNSPVEPGYIELSGEALKQRKFEIAATPASKSKGKWLWVRNNREFEKTDFKLAGSSCYSFSDLAVYARRWIHKLWYDWMHAASSSGSHVRCKACQRGVWLQTWWRSWVCHSIWRCHFGGKKLSFFSFMWLSLSKLD